MKYATTWSLAADRMTLHRGDCHTLKRAGWTRNDFEADSLEHAYELTIERLRKAPRDLFYGLTHELVRVCKFCEGRSS